MNKEPNNMEIDFEKHPPKVGDKLREFLKGWRDIESAPRDGTEVLVWVECAGTDIVHIAWYRNEEEWGRIGESCEGWKNIEDWLGWWSYTNNSVSQEKLCDYKTPKYWMPIPTEEDFVALRQMIADMKVMRESLRRIDNHVASSAPLTWFLNEFSLEMMDSVHEWERVASKLLKDNTDVLTQTENYLPLFEEIL